MSKAKFDLALPGLYKDKWREAYRADKDDAPRLSSYQAPGGQPIPFIYKDLDFSGGQAVDTAEYPFFGLWSNEALNHKPQTITVHGFLRGEYYLQQRTAFLDALTAATSDEAPGNFDHPLWGRFKVIVEDYSVKETADENGQCEISLTLKRAGVPLETRAEVLAPADFTKPEAAAQSAVKIFAKINAHVNTLLRGFGSIKGQLLNIIGTVQAAETTLNALTNEITGIANLMAQGIQTPALLAQALVNAVFSITAAVESAQQLIHYFSRNDNSGIIAMQFLSAAKWKLPLEAASVQQEKTKTAIEELYRTVSLCAAAQILMQMEGASYEKMKCYWALYSELENSISLEDPELFQSVTEMRSALAAALSQSALNNELKKNIQRPVPLLYLSHHLGCDDEKLRAMNAIEDSLLVSGEVAYV